MTARKKRATLDNLGEYVREVADLMGLQNWHFRIDTDISDDDRMAECLAVGVRHTAVISFRRDWHSWSARDLANTVVHELMHCHMQPIEESLRSMRSMFLNDPYLPIVATLHEDQYESMIDLVADNWSRAMPQPTFLES